jgi:multiple sugar transport system substrate-binding protein
MWAVFNKGDAQVKASVEFLNWFSEPAQQLTWMRAAGSLPIRQSIEQDPGYKDWLNSYPGIQAMVDNLSNAVHTRPAVTQYPRVSKVVGDAIASVLLGRAQPKDALDQAAQEANVLLNVPG